jgi:undecaprenyl-diphosphatase
VSTRRQLVCIAGLLAALGLLCLVAGHDTPPRWEHDVVDAMTRLPRVLGLPLEVVMQLGLRPLVPVCALLALAVTRRWQPAVAVLAAGLVVGWGTDHLKAWSDRPRPVGVRIRDHAGGAGFTSGHTANAFAMATVLAVVVLPGRWRWLALGLATGVGLARMYVGAHYPLDVLGGAAWGAAVGWTAALAAALALSGGGRASARPGCSAGSASSHP